MERCHDSPFSETGHIHKYDGTLLGTIKFPLSMSRATFHGLLHEYAEKLGIDIQFSTVATYYFENEDLAGVVLGDGTVLSADVVVAADGIGSKSWNLVSGYKEKPISSGFALFRSTYPVERAIQNPLVAKEFEGCDQKANLHLGPGAHIIVAKSETEIVFMLTHRVCIES